MKYKELTVIEGRRYLPRVWNLFFKPLAEPDFFPEPGKSLELRGCAEFREDDEVWVFVADAGLVAFLDGAKEGLYLFGAYNQINVCQMRARGSVSRVHDNAEAQALKTRLRTAIEGRIDANVDKLSKEEANTRYAILESGILFRFCATAYAYDTYERG